MSLDLTDDQSTLVQVMAWCRQATSNYPSQCWPKSLSLTRPEWVNKDWNQKNQPFWCWNQNIPGELGQHHCYWCHGSLHYQAISNTVTMHDRWVLTSFNEKRFQLSAPTYCWEMIANGKISLWLYSCSTKISLITGSCTFAANQTRIYRQTSNINHTLVGNIIVDHSDVVGASPVGAAPTTSSFSTSHLSSMDWAKTTTRRDEKHLSFGIWCDLY